MLSLFTNVSNFACLFLGKAQSVQFPRLVDDLEEGGGCLNVSGADRGTVVYHQGNPESLQIGSKCQLFKQTVCALFTGTRFPPGVYVDLGHEGAGSLR